MLARRTRALGADAGELSDLVAAEAEEDETYRYLLIVPDVGAATTAQLVASVRASSVPPRVQDEGHAPHGSAQDDRPQEAEGIYAVMCDVRPYAPA